MPHEGPGPVGAGYNAGAHMPTNARHAPDASHRPRPRVVIVGGGFGGLAAARALHRAPVDVVLLDRRNYHLFQPLLYQVATAGLSPADIAAPIRHVLRSQRNCEVVLGEASRVDAAGKRVELADGAALPFDYLVLATGATHSYFGHEEWAPLAPGLKDIPDATAIRRQFLLAFEAAEREQGDAARRARLTFVVVGGGPTGVEMAGAMAEIARRAIPKDFRHIDTSTARVILYEGVDRLLPAMHAKLSARAKRDLERLGVEVRLSSRVVEIDAGGVWIERVGERERVETPNIVWAAGVRASPLARTLSGDGSLFDSSGRVRVAPDLSVPGTANVFVIGDLATVCDPRTKQEVPGMCPGAAQMGKYVGKVIAREASAALHKAGATPELPAATPPETPRRKPFHYVNKGVMATIGRASAVVDLRGLLFAGFPAWVFWLMVHIFFLIGFRNRVLVMFQWAWAYFTFDRGARLIVGDQREAPITDAARPPPDRPPTEPPPPRSASR